MTRTIRYTIEMHPDTVDSHRPVPNAWLCKGYDERDQLVQMQCGDTPEQALHRAQYPAAHARPSTGTLTYEIRRALALLLLRAVARLWPLRNMSDVRVYEAIGRLAGECSR